MEQIQLLKNQLHVYLKRHRPQIMPPNQKAGLYEIVEKYIPPKKGINIFEDESGVIENPTYKDVLMYMIKKQKLGEHDMLALVSKLDKAIDASEKDPNYRPEKASVLKAVIHLNLNEFDAQILLESVGYTLRKEDTSDLIIRFCIEKQVYDLAIVNKLLRVYNIPVLS